MSRNKNLILGQMSVAFDDLIMTQQHPDLADEQAYIDHAYDCLETSRKAAFRVRGLNEASMGGTFQARFERNAFDGQLVRRLEELELGDASLVFGRIDRYAESPDQLEAFHIGRLAVADEDREPVVVDWRAPVAEPFYRATGRDSMGLARRRHFTVESRNLLGIEDEFFGEGHLGLGHDEGLGGEPGVVTADSGLRGYSTLLAALERGRTGTLGDIVATIQGEQDEIIRSPQTGVLVVQGGPGTGKTVVALHRAAYLLYTHRFPLEDQGVLVIGPNRVFLRYIERVLPSLGEAGVKQAVLADLIPGVQFRRPDEPGDSPEAVKIKGEERMSDMVDNAIADRKRPLRNDFEMPFRAGYVRLRAAESARIVKNAKRRFKRHNSGRRAVEGEFWSALADSYLDPEIGPRDVKDTLRHTPEARAALDTMWPLLTPAQLLHDLFGSRALLKLAARGVMSESEALALYRERSATVDDVRWALSDVALLDDVRDVLGPRPGKGGKIDELDEIRTYGHIVIDEVQDLTPMQLKMATRRSLSGAMTIVGDLAQATGPLAPNEWDDVLAHLPDRKPARVIGLSVGYRIPGQIMELANKVMAVATPSLRAPDSVRVGDVSPTIVRAPSTELLGKTVADEVLALAGAIPGASLGIVAPDQMIDDLSVALTEAGVDHGTATRTGLDAGVTLVPVSVVKGLELDGVVVVEPSVIVDSIEHGMRALYVALTRSTQRLTVVHADELPAPLR
ncbi:HelD family protein [uncultured Ilumatobacter sp.]|uniref:HelD family protein n=1 Tax=uncultured Ilumatobacter sp. TaxID=879968 RepID=UPI00374F16EB